MQQTFEQILLSLLQKYESNPEGDEEGITCHRLAWSLTRQYHRNDK